MSAAGWVALGWFIGVPGVLLGLWVGQVGPAAAWDWGTVLMPWPIGAVVVFMFCTAGTFDDA